MNALLDGSLGFKLQVWCYTLLHSGTGLGALYATTALFSLAGLRQGRAKISHYFLWPMLTVPLTAGVWGLFEALLWGLPRLGVPLSLIGVIMLAAILAMLSGLVGGLLWARRGQALDGAQRRGAIVTDGAAAQNSSAKQRVSAIKSAKQAPASRAQFPITIAGVTMPLKDEVMHTKIAGTTGTGKSTAIREMVHAALYRQDRAVIADPDAGYLSRFYDPRRGDVILNPFDARSAKWDPFSEIKAPYDIEELARALIPDRDGPDSQWISYGRTFLGCVLGQMKQAGMSDVGELYRLLTAAPKAELKLLLAGTAAARFLEEGSDKQFAGTQSITADHVKCLDYIRRQPPSAAPFSISTWVKSGRGVLFLPYRADQIAALRSIISVWMRITISKTLSLPEGDARIWFIIDELDALGTIDGLSDALTRLRKFGGRCVIGFQSIAQISTRYGSGVAQAVVENCGNTLILRCSASENGGTSRFASALIGVREVVRLANSRSQSSRVASGGDQLTQGQSEQHASEPAVLASEIEQLPDRTGFLKLASQPAWMKVQFPYYDVPKVAEPFVGIDE
ncbi:MAG: type IV secretion system DNA-binding domain-containing protein [Pseudomonadota bacterium]|nr:type IV secretion system DNA-binding domain-containing protein [Pseudomonadota bacterium]